MTMDPFYSGLFIGIVFGGTGIYIFYAFLKKAYPNTSTRPVVLEKTIDIRVTVEVLERNLAGGLMVGTVLKPLPIPWSQMVDLAKKVEGNGYQWKYSLSGIKAGNSVSRPQYESLSAIFLEGGIIQKRVNATRDEYIVTELKGKEFFHQWAGYPPLTKSELIKWGENRGDTQTHTKENEEK